MLNKHKIAHPMRLLAVLVLGVGAIIAALLWGLNTRSELDANSVSFDNRASLGTSLAIHPGSLDTKVGEVRMVTVDLDASEEVVGSNVVITFDPAIVKVVPINNGAGTQTAQYLNTDGSVFSNFSRFSLDNAKGYISFGGTASAKHAVKGSGRVAVIAFKSLKVGSTQLLLKFNSGKGQQSSAISKLKHDVLKQVSNAVILVTK